MYKERMVLKMHFVLKGHFANVAFNLTLLRSLERCACRKCFVRVAGVWNLYMRLLIVSLLFPRQMKHIFGLFSLYKGDFALSSALAASEILAFSLILTLPKATSVLNYLW